MPRAALAGEGVEAVSESRDVSHCALSEPAAGRGVSRHPWPTKEQ